MIEVDNLDDILKATLPTVRGGRAFTQRPREMRGESVALVEFGQQNDHAEKICSCPMLCSSAPTQLIRMSIKPSDCSDPP